MAHLGIVDKTIIFILGGIILGYFVYNLAGAVLGGIMGFALSKFV